MTQHMQPPPPTPPQPTPPQPWPPQPPQPPQQFPPPPPIPQQQIPPSPIPQQQIPQQQIPQQRQAPQYGQPEYAAPYGPPMGYPGAPAPARKRRTGRIVGIIVGVVVLVAGLVVGAVLLFGKSTLNTAELQKDITQLTQEKAGVPATDVSCPADREIKAGDQFTCTAQVDGQAAKFTVKQQDDKGNVHIQLDNTLVVVSQLEDLLSKQVASDVGFDVTSSCDASGHKVLIDGIGKQVRCTVTDASDHSNSIDVEATVDEQGHVSYQEA
jgi:hypothetical protein